MTNLNKTAQYLERLHQDLAELEALVCEGEGLGGEISLEDILTFPYFAQPDCCARYSMAAKIDGLFVGDE